MDDFWPDCVALGEQISELQGIQTAVPRKKTASAYFTSKQVGPTAFCFCKAAYMNKEKYIRESALLQRHHH